MSSKSELLSWIRSNSFDQYGAILSRDQFREFLGIEIPAIGTKSEYESLALAELTAISLVRDILIEEGKYIKQTMDSYRILLPSENKIQVDIFMRSASSKLLKATKLQENTPVAVGETPTNVSARLMAKERSIRDARVYGSLPAAN